MEIKEIQSKEIWEKFLSNCREKTFLQSWNWGKVQKEMGNKIWRLGLLDKENLMAAAFAYKIQAKRGTFLLVPHGPVFDSEAGMNNYELLKEFLRALKKIAKAEKASFIRVAPLIEENNEIFDNLGFIQSPMHASAYEATLRLDLSLSENDLLMNMRKTTRYLVRQAQKTGNIEIIKSDSISDLKIYQKLVQNIVKSQQFVPFSFDLVAKQFEVFSKDRQIYLFLAKYQGEPAAGALIVFWSGIAFYHQAALLPEYHNIPAAHLLQWEAIKEAKNSGCKLYDFWGYVDPKKYPKHPWAGPSLFKAGFGGKIHNYLKTQDLPLAKKYWLTYFFETLRKIKRGL